MNTLDQHARAAYRQAQAHLSARTVAELHRRRITAINARDTARTASGWLGWPLATALGGLCALTLALGLRSPSFPPDAAPATIASADALDDAADALAVLDALDTLNLTALDEDSEFFLWLAAHEASLLAME